MFWLTIGRDTIHCGGHSSYFLDTVMKHHGQHWLIEEMASRSRGRVHDVGGGVSFFVAPQASLISQGNKLTCVLSWIECWAGNRMESPGKLSGLLVLPPSPQPLDSFLGLAGHCQGNARESSKSLKFAVPTVGPALLP